MGWGFRRSKKVAPGVRVTVGKRSAGVSVGPRHAHIGFNTRTGAYLSGSIPGTGIYWREDLRKLAPALAGAYRSLDEYLKSLPPPPPSNPFLVNVMPAHSAGSRISGVALCFVIWITSPVLAMVSNFALGGGNWVGQWLLWLALGGAAYVVSEKNAQVKESAVAPVQQKQKSINAVAHRAWDAILEGRKAEAIEDLNYLRVETPNNPYVLFHLGEALTEVDPRAGRDIMLELLKRTGGRFPDAAQVYIILGCQFYALGQESNAERAFWKASKLAGATTGENQDRLTAIYLQTLLLIKMGRSGEAFQVLQNVNWSLEPVVWQAMNHRLRAACYEKMGNLDATHDEWAKAEALDPSNPV